MGILNYTTSIDAFKTVSEIQQILSKRSAEKIVIDTQSGNPIGLTFILSWQGHKAAFSLPCNFEGVLKAMQKDKKVPRSKCTKEQALKVSWRILKDWVEAQCAIIDAELASMPEVFLPYAIAKDGLTLYNHIQKNSSHLLLNS